MKFKTVRLKALQAWQKGTKRTWDGKKDDYNKSFECTWQNCYGTPIDESDHYSVFCSIGDWNTNLTDFLTDDRFDDLDLKITDDKVTLFRQYTKILLCASEILTDFQDILSTLKAGALLQELQLFNTSSRKLLDKKSRDGDTHRFFTFVNNICKHKINNIHICNHHLDIHFEDSGDKTPTKKTIKIRNINLFITGKVGAPATKIPDTIEIPRLEDIVDQIIKGYNIVDEEFREDRVRFENFCKLYNCSSII